MKFLVFKKCYIWALVAVIVAIAGATAFAYLPSSTMPKPTYVVVIDAGHGGRDGGATGVKTGVSESELNLKYACTLRDLCQDFGIGVVMTRSNMNGLYEETASNKKRSEMEKRRKIINSSNADLMISLHMNSFPLPSCSGAQIFYAKDSESGFNLAKSVQTSVCQSFDNARDYVTVGDYFVLNVSAMPAVLVECGFLSNPEEEKNLLDETYRQNFCYALLAGILSYFKM